jgi:beta-lactamase regulating signal transducer with metallopeptidase domain
VNTIDVLFWASAKGAVIIALAGVVVLALRNWPAAVRHVVWTFAIGAQLLLPVLILLVPARSIGLGPIGPVLSLAESRLREPGVPLSPSTRGVAVAPPKLSVEPSNGTTVQAATHIQGAGRTATARLLLLVWLTGALLVTIRFSVGTIRVSRDMRRARRPIRRDWIVLAGQVQEAMQVRRHVQLAATASVVPYTWGILSPVICLPPEAESWSTERLRMVLVHEMAHVQRFDGLTELMAQLALVVFWFNPILWPAVRRMRTEREHACDDRVLLDGIKPSTYVQELVTMMKSLSGGAPAPAFAAIAMARRSQFESRMLAVLNGRANRQPLSRRTFATLGGVTALIIVGLASVQPAIAGQRNDRARLAVSALVKDPMISAATEQGESAADWKKSDFDDLVRDCHRNSEKGRISYCEVRTVDPTGLTNRVSFDGGYLDGVIFKTSASHGASARALVRGQAVSEEEARTVAQGVQLIASNGTVHSDGPALGGSVQWSVLYEITLPPASIVQARVDNGEISLDGFTGVADLNAVNGPIEVFGSSGNIHGRTRNGPLMVGLAGRHWDGEGLDLESKNGPIYFAIPESYSAHIITGTINGPLRVDYPMELKRISRRNIEADIGGGGTTIRVTTENGPADIRR